MLAFQQIPEALQAVNEQLLRLSGLGRLAAYVFMCKQADSKHVITNAESCEIKDKQIENVLFGASSKLDGHIPRCNSCMQDLSTWKSE